MDGECLKCPSISSPDGLLVSGPGGAPREDGAASSSPAGPFAKEAPQTGVLTIRGSVGSSGNPGVLPDVPQVGWAYVAADPGVYGGVAAAEGDLICCVSASPVRWAVLLSDAADGNIVHRTGDEIVGGDKIFNNSVVTVAGHNSTRITLQMPDVVRGTATDVDSYATLAVIDSLGSSYNDTSARLAALEYKAPSATNPDYEVQLVAFSYTAAGEPEIGTAAIAAGRDAAGIPFSVAMPTSDQRSNGNDIVTRGWRITEAEIDALSA